MQGERVDDLHLVVIGIARGHLLHRLVVGAQADVDVDLVVVSEIGAQCVDPAAFALRLRADFERLFERGPGGVGLCARRRSDQRVAELIHCNAPIGDRAIGVLLEDALKHSARNEEPVRVDHRHAALELRLHLGIAGGGEVQFAELLL